MAGHQCQGRGLQYPASPLQVSTRRHCLLMQLDGRGSHLKDQHPTCQVLDAASLRGIHVQADWGRWNGWRLHPVPEKPVTQSSLISCRQQHPKLGISTPDTQLLSYPWPRAARHQGEFRCGREHGRPRSGWSPQASVWLGAAAYQRCAATHRDGERYPCWSYAGKRGANNCAQHHSTASHAYCAGFRGYAVLPL